MRKARRRGAQAQPPSFSAKTSSEKEAATNNAAARQMFRALLERLSVGVAAVNAAGDILYANPQLAYMITGRQLGHLTGKNLAELVSPASRRSLQVALASGMHDFSEGDMRILERGSDSPRTLRLSFFPISLSPDHVDAIGMAATEVTALMQTTSALEHSKASVLSISARLLQLQDEERRRLARELHDTTGQELAAAAMTLDTALRNIDPTDHGVRTAVKEAVDLVRKTERDIRTFSYLLHPPLLDDMGLSSAIAWYVEGFTKRTGIAVDLLLPQDFSRLPAEYELALFRVIQESLTNVYRHSGASRATVTVYSDAQHVCASVRDRGKSLDATRHAELKPGVGIQSMKGRLEPIGGTLDVHHSPGGTEIVAKIPLGRVNLPVEPLRPVAEQAVSERVSSGPDIHARKRIVIADDHELIRRGIKTLLADQPDLEICGEAVNGVEAIAETNRLKPDLLILDLSMPELGGLGATFQIRPALPKTKILIYTTHAHDEFASLARRAGCDGFVLKSDASQDLLQAVRAVLRGEKFFPTQTAKTHSG